MRRHVRRRDVARGFRELPVPWLVVTVLGLVGGAPGGKTPRDAGDAKESRVRVARTAELPKRAL